MTRAAERAPRQLGTLGTGNHFVEVCLDETDRVWLMLHSGSRGVGNAIGSHFIALAKKRCEAEGIKLPNADLAWLPEGTPEFVAYVDAVAWAQDYAHENRRAMMTSVVAAMTRLFGEERFAVVGPEAVECHHNYVNREDHFGESLWVTRKGGCFCKRTTSRLVGDWIAMVHVSSSPMKLIAFFSFLVGCACVGCSGSIQSIPLPSGGSITVTDGGATICTTIPLAVAIDAGLLAR